MAHAPGLMRQMNVNMEKGDEIRGGSLVIVVVVVVVVAVAPVAVVVAVVVVLVIVVIVVLVVVVGVGKRSRSRRYRVGREKPLSWNVRTSVNPDQTKTRFTMLYSTIATPEPES